MLLSVNPRWFHPLPIIVALYLCLSLAYAQRTPAWQAPDEPAHWNYIAAIANEGCCPRLETGDWDSELLAALTSQRFADITAEQLQRIRYENHHPPLYYALAAPIFRLTAGDIFALRGWSVLLGLGIVVNTYRIGRTVAPRRPTVAALAALFVACLPQHLHLLASVNNDALAWLLISQMTYFSLCHLRGLSLQREGRFFAAILSAAGAFLLLAGGETRWLGAMMLVVSCVLFGLLRREDRRTDAWLFGSLIGLIFLTKTTAYLMLPVVMVAIFPQKRDLRAATQTIAWLLLPALLLGATWWLRNLIVYGFPDLLGLLQHNRVVVGQARSSEWIQQRGLLRYLADLLRVTYTSFWGQFGWMALPLQGWRLYFTFAMSALATFGGWASWRTKRNTSSFQILMVKTSLAVLMFAIYNLSFVQWQGRYLYAALIPLALAWAVGVRTLRGGLGRWSTAFTLVLAASLPLFSLEILLNVIPALKP